MLKSLRYSNRKPHINTPGRSNMSRTRFQKIAIKFIKILAWVLAVFLFLFLTITILLQFPSIQTRIIGFITDSISQQTQSRVEIDRVAIRFPKSVGLKGIYLEDSEGDTLLYAGSIFVDIGMTGLLRNRVNVNKLEIKNLEARMLRQEPDTVFNYQFIIDALAAEESPEKDTLEEPASWQVNIDRVNLQHVKYHLKDHFSGFELKVSLEDFNTRLRSADLLNEKYHTERIRITGADIAITQQPRSVPSQKDTTDMGMPELDILVQAIELQNTSFVLNSHDGTAMLIRLEELNLIPENIQLHQMLVELEKLDVKQLQADFTFPPAETKDKALAQHESEASKVNEQDFYFRLADSMEWEVKLQSLQMQESSFAMRQQAGAASTSKSFDPENINLQNINISAEDIHVSPHNLNIKLNNLSTRFSDDFSITRLSADIALDSRSRIDNFLLQTPSSHLEFSLRSEGSLLELSPDIMERLPIELQLKESHLQSDLAYLVPAMNEFYFNWPGSKGLKLGGNISGTLANLRIDNFWTTAPGYFNTQLHAEIRGLPHIDSLYLDISEWKLLARPEDFFSNMPDSLQPGNIQLPEYLYMETQTRGSILEFQTKLDIRTNLGNMALQASMQDIGDDLKHMEGSLSMDSLRLGQIIKQDEMRPQPLGIKAQWKGEGSKPENFVAQAQISINNLNLMQYDYDDLLLEVELQDSVLNLSTQYRDEMLALELEAALGAFMKDPTLITMLNIEYAQLARLNLIEEELLVSTLLETDLVFDIEDFFNGSLTLSNTRVASEGTVYGIPDLSIQSESNPGDYRLKLRSSFATGDFQGNFSPSAIPQTLANHFAHYYDGEGSLAEAPLDTLPPQQFELALILVQDNYLNSVLIPQLHGFDTLSLNMAYNSQLRDIILEADMASMQYADIEVSGFALQVVSDRQSLDFEVLLSQLSLGDVAFNQLELQGAFAEKMLDFTFAFKDSEENPLYSMQGQLARNDSLYSLNIKPENLLINGELWHIPPDNLVVTGPGHIYVHNFIISSEGRELKIQSEESEENYPILDIHFRQIDLGRLTAFTAGRVPPVGGLFEGDVKLINIFESPAFLANLDITDFSYAGDTLGNIVLKAENPEADLYDVSLSLSSDLTNLSVKGFYRTGDNPSIDFDTRLERLHLPSFEAFAGGSITHLKGFLSGNMKITGTPETPMIGGDLNINETSFRVPALNAGYFLRSEQITFDRQNVRLQNIALEDSAGRRATLNGQIGFAELSQLNFDLRLSSRNFQLMNVLPEQDESYHGRILMDTDLTLKGSQDNPVVEGIIRLNEGSSFTFTLPQSTPEAIGDEGVVEFVQESDTLFMQMARETADPAELQSTFEIFDVSVNIEVDRNTEVSIIIDEYAGDFLKLRGGGQLSLNIDPGGRIILSGRYDISDGEYLLTFYDVVRRNFRIQSGSYISWSGDPLDAQMEITAIHTVRTSPANLMAGMGASQAESVALRRQFPFHVHLNMKGILLEPQISFELKLPQEHQAALDGTLAARLEQINQNQSDLNKQVFALLIMGTFIRDNPLDGLSGGGGGLSSTARSSVSQMLSQQLNRFSDRFIRGVDINFEIESFEAYDNGQTVGRTELQMEVSRNFFDERIRVSVGGNVELEDDATRETAPGDIAGDFSIEYLITPEGNLRAKGFRTRNYGDIFDGQVIETGISLIFSRSYNRFRELFKKEEEENIAPPENNSNP